MRLPHLLRVIQKLLHVIDPLRLRLQVLHACCEVTFEYLVAHFKNDGYADVIKELISIGVSEECIPQPNAVGHIKLLAHQKHKPAQRVELRIDPFLLEFLPDRWVNRLKDRKHRSTLAIYAVLLLIKVAHEAILDLTHQITEAEKDV